MLLRLTRSWKSGDSRSDGPSALAPIDASAELTMERQAGEVQRVVALLTDRRTAVIAAMKHSQLRNLDAGASRKPDVIMSSPSV